VLIIPKSKLSINSVNIDIIHHFVSEIRIFNIIIEFIKVIISKIKARLQLVIFYQEIMLKLVLQVWLIYFNHTLYYTNISAYCVRNFSMVKLLSTLNNNLKTGIGQSPWNMYQLKIDHN